MSEEQITIDLEGVIRGYVDEIIDEGEGYASMTVELAGGDPWPENDIVVIISEQDKNRWEDALLEKHVTMRIKMVWPYNEFLFLGIEDLNETEL